MGPGPGRGPAAVAPGPYKLVTFGQSFWWTGEQRVAETVYGMLEPGGALALIVHTVTGLVTAVQARPTAMTTCSMTRHRISCRCINSIHRADSLP